MSVRSTGGEWFPSVRAFAGGVSYVGLMDYASVKEGPRDRAESVEQYVQRTGQAPRELTTSRYMWELIRNKYAEPRDFVCPDTSDVPAGDVGVVKNGARPEDLYDFGGLSACSYGVQVPFGPHAKPSATLPSAMVVFADKGPWSEAGEKRLRADMGVLGTISASSSDDDLHQANSPNHHKKGQNVMCADGHGIFLRRPWMDGAQDNVYTVWGPRSSGADEALHRLRGVAPDYEIGRAVVPQSDTDSLIYP